MLKSKILLFMFIASRKQQVKGLYNPFTSIKTLSVKNCENIVSDWIKFTKQNNLPIYNLFPLYSASARLYSNKNITYHSDIFLGYEYNSLVAKPSQLQPNNNSNVLSHICVCSLNTKNKNLVVEQICMNPKIVMEDNILYRNSTFELKNKLEEYSEKYKYNVTWTKMKDWDYGRYYLLLNEDKFLL